MAKKRTVRQGIERLSRLLPHTPLGYREPLHSRLDVLVRAVEKVVEKDEYRKRRIEELEQRVADQNATISELTRRCADWEPNPFDGTGENPKRFRNIGVSTGEMLINGQPTLKS